MMIRLLCASALLMLGGCSAIGVSSDSVGIVTREYGQCVVNTKAAPAFKRKKVTYRCENGRVLLGKPYEKEGKVVIDSGVLEQKENRYIVRDRSRASVVRGLHSVCEFQPEAGNGNRKIRRYYFDEKRKECRPFIWSGEGGIVPFKSMDSCQQQCYY